jgi:hypothetical protein
VKLDNPIGISMTSSAMSGWNYGSIADRLSLKLWLETIYLRNIHQSSLYIIGSLAIILSLFKLKDSHTKKIILLFVLLFFLPFFIFTNLHIRHNYYQIANSLFYSAAVGISIVYLFDHYSAKLGKTKMPLMAVVTSIFIYYNFIFFSIGPLNNKLYAPNEDVKLRFLLAKYIKENNLVGQIGQAKLLIFSHKPAKWLFKDRIDVKIVVVNSFIPINEPLTQSWLESHYCVVYLGNIRPTAPRMKKIVNL